mmetsp:Transcript_64997/g.174513  ORF Transcript_64997/g.174513 Transcript_64997/m.174513 type:complete len:226 (+) Transcript_64997:411-1088(+)
MPVDVKYYSEMGKESLTTRFLRLSFKSLMVFSAAFKAADFFSCDSNRFFLRISRCSSSHLSRAVVSQLSTIGALLNIDDFFTGSARGAITVAEPPKKSPPNPRSTAGAVVGAGALCSAVPNNSSPPVFALLPPKVFSSEPKSAAGALEPPKAVSPPNPSSPNAPPAAGAAFTAGASPNPSNPPTKLLAGADSPKPPPPKSSSPNVAAGTAGAAAPMVGRLSQSSS